MSDPLAFIFRVPGEFTTGTIHPNGKRVTYDCRQTAAWNLPDGWHRSLEEAAEAAYGPLVPPPVEEPAAPPPEPAAEAAPAADPTREELEAQAERLGVKLDRRWGDKRLMQEIVDALEAKGDGV